MNRNEAINEHGMRIVLLLEKMELLPMGKVFLATIELPNGDYLHREADVRNPVFDTSRYLVTA